MSIAAWATAYSPKESRTSGIRGAASAPVHSNAGLTPAADGAYGARGASNTEDPALPPVGTLDQLTQAVIAVGARDYASPIGESLGEQNPET